MHKEETRNNIRDLLRYQYVLTIRVEWSVRLCQCMCCSTCPWEGAGCEGVWVLQENGV